MQGICKSSSNNNTNSARETEGGQYHVTAQNDLKADPTGLVFSRQRRARGGEGCLKGAECTKIRANWTCNIQVGRGMPVMARR